MKKIVLLVLTLIIGLSSYSQGRRDRMGNPIVNRKPTDEEIARYEQKLEERKDEFISNFLTTLEADDFQKEIIKQYLNSYFEAKKKVLEVKYERVLERDEAIKNLDESHFKDLEELISENDMTKIKDMIKGDFDESEVKKKNKKKKKKRKKKKKDKDQ